MNETKQLRRNNLMDIKEQLVEVRAYLDQELHPVVSPDHWNIYSELCDMVNNISALLAKQEPIKVERRMEETEWNVCGNCGSHVIHKWAYCPYCGKRLKWDD